jgi:MFS family permease
MEEKERQSAFMSALVTEHFVLQTASNGIVAEMTARASLYVLSLSSALVAMGFASRSRSVFLPFVATVLPGVFLLGLFTVARLIDSNIENMQFLIAIARIRRFYRTLTPEAAVYFAAQAGRWPESRSTPALRLGTLVAFVTTSASMIAFLNSIVAGAWVTLFASHVLVGLRTLYAVTLGVAAAVLLMAGFIVYQQKRIVEVDESREERQESDHRAT